MSNEIPELPVFPTSAPTVFRDPGATEALVADALGRLAEVVDVPDDALSLATPCAGFNVGQLRVHALGWLQFFAAALLDPTATSPRPDPESFTLANDSSASEIVRAALADLQEALDADVAGQMVTMQSSLMAGDGVLGMALGEYVIHAWGHRHRHRSALRGTRRGRDPGPRLSPNHGRARVSLGFAGRDPYWSPSGPRAKR